MKYWLPTSQDTEKIARELSGLLNAPLVLTLTGEIGAGKTTFVRALLQALGYQGKIKSPTFSIVETYPKNPLPWVFHHFDLYRILDEQELDYIGFRDYFTKDAICCIEWPECAGSLLGSVDVRMTFQIEGVGRRMNTEAYTSAGEVICKQLAGNG